MTRRLYYDDAYTQSFSARVLEVLPAADGRHGVILDETLFYPTSGGQMHDVGTLAGCRVEDVIDEGERIVHVVSGTPPEPGTMVEGAIDADRRAHHRQQHSGQHLFSRVVEDHFGWPTLSSRLGETMNTLEIAAPELSPGTLVEMEELTNRVIRQARPVRVLYLDDEEAGRAGLRKKVDRDGPVRIVEVEGVDRCACGGTHVGNTGEIGSLAIVGTEKIRGGTRIQFLCGERATRWRRERVQWLDQTARLLTTGHEQVLGTVERLQEESRESRKRIGRLATEVVQIRAAGWAGVEPDPRGRRLVTRILDADEALAAPAAARALAREESVVGVLVIEEGDKRQVLMGAHEGAGVDCGAVLAAVLRGFGGKGGGQTSFARGGCAGVQSDELLAAFVEALGSDADEGR